MKRKLPSAIKYVMNNLKDNALIRPWIDDESNRLESLSSSVHVEMSRDNVNQL